MVFDYIPIIYEYSHCDHDSWLIVLLIIIGNDDWNDGN